MVKQEGSYWMGMLSRPYESREVMHMSDFELLTVVFTVIGLLLSAYKLGRK